MRNDVTFLAIILGLFVVAFLLVVACDRIIGPDEEALGDGGVAAAGDGHEREAGVAA